MTRRLILSAGALAAIERLAAQTEQPAYPNGVCSVCRTQLPIPPLQYCPAPSGTISTGTVICDPQPTRVACPTCHVVSEVAPAPKVKPQ